MCERVATLTEHLHYCFYTQLSNYSYTLAGTSLSLQLDIYCLKWGALPLRVQTEYRCVKEQLSFVCTNNIPLLSLYGEPTYSRPAAIFPHRPYFLKFSHQIYQFGTKSKTCFTLELLAFCAEDWWASVLSHKAKGFSEN